MLEIIHFSPFFIVVKDPHYNHEFYYGGGPHSYIQLSAKKITLLALFYMGYRYLGYLTDPVWPGLYKPARKQLVH